MEKSILKQISLESFGKNVHPHMNSNIWTAGETAEMMVKHGKGECILLFGFIYVIHVQDLTVYKGTGTK